MLRRELRERFIGDLTPAERAFFLIKAREAVAHGYPASEDLFHYCYFLTLKERLRTITTQGGGGYLRLLLVEGRKETEEAVVLYRRRLEASRRPEADRQNETAERFIRYLSE